MFHLNTILFYLLSNVIFNTVYGWWFFIDSQEWPEADIEKKKDILKQFSSSLGLEHLKKQDNVMWCLLNWELNPPCRERDELYGYGYYDLVGSYEMCMGVFGLRVPARR